MRRVIREKSAVEDFKRFSRRQGNPERKPFPLSAAISFPAFPHHAEETPGRVILANIFLSSASIVHFRFWVSAERKIVWLKEIFRLAQSGGELSIFCAGNARPATNGKALSTL